MPRSAQQRALELYGRSYYQVRKETGFNEWGFLTALPRNVDPISLHDAVIEAAYPWQVLAIAYFNEQAHPLARSWAEITTQAPIRARGEGLLPAMEKAVECAARQGDRSRLYDTALIMRPWSQRPRMEQILKRYQAELALTDCEVKEYSYGW